jgi:hypothetical protein
MREEIVSLQSSVLRLKKAVLLLTIGWIATLTVWLAWGNSLNVHAAELQSLRIRRLAIVDKNGIERVVISAPVPEPMIGGARGKRDNPMSGILIYDPKGNERGGYGTSDGEDLSALLTLDSEKDQVFTAYANAGSGATVWVANEKRENVLMSSHNTALFEITRGKQIIYKQPPDAPDLKQ